MAWLAQGLKATVFRLEREQEDMANSRLKLTQTNVQRLIRAHDGAKKVRHWDTEVPKLFLAITPNGCAAYKLQIVKPDGSKTDAKLIAANEGSPELARVMAMKELGRMALGEADLVTRKRITKEEAEKEKASTFAALSSRFMTTPEKSPPRIKQRTYDERERLLRVHILPILGGATIPANWQTPSARTRARDPGRSR